MSRCRSCGSDNLQEVFSLGGQYLSDFRSDDSLPPKYPLDLIFCDDCYLTQLKHTTPSSLMYHDNYGFKSGVNNTIKNDLKEIVHCGIRAIAPLREGDSVLDIGSNDGTLLSNYPKNLYRVGFDPVKKFKEEAEQHADKIYDTYFHNTGDLPQFRLITIISCFYDLDEPNSFVISLKNLLAPGGTIIIQQNYLGSMLRNTAYDNISHEHIEYYSLLSLDNLLERHGLEVYRVTFNTINGGSFRTYISHKGEMPLDVFPSFVREQERVRKLDSAEPFINFRAKASEEAGKLHQVLSDIHREEKSTYIWGASTRGQVILQYSNITKELAPYAVERNPEKVGKKIAGLQIPIISEEQAREEKPEYMLILPYFFSQEIMDREKELLSNGTKAIIPLPELMVG